MRIDEIPLQGLTWTPGHTARVWIAQPYQSFPVQPYSPTPGALRLFKAIVAGEERLPEPRLAPTIVVLPELSLRYEDLPEVRELILAARPNTLFISGVAQLTETEARTIEEGADLWSGDSEGRFTNCAIVGIGGADKLFLQPKRLPSRWETNLWKGEVVRYFTGTYLGFSVVICSELLEQPAGRTTLEELRDMLRRQRRELHLLVWIQHNRDPRSELFNDSLKVLAEWERVTTIMASSRPDKSLPRRGNYAVSGVLVAPQKLPSLFEFLDKDYHYVEPCPLGEPLSRIALLRYDADAYQVNTVLADHIGTSDSSVKKASICKEARPYILNDENLDFSPDNQHLRDLTKLAANAASLASSEDVASGVQESFVELGTRGFLAFLDRAIVPNPPSFIDWHGPGNKHKGGDTACRCWEHRKCLDSMEASPALQEIFECLALIRMNGVEILPRHDGLANVAVTHEGRQIAIRVVSADGRDAAAVERSLHPREPTADTPSLIIGTKSRGWRPPVASISAGRATPLGAVNPARAAKPKPRAKYSEDVLEAIASGNLQEMFAELCA